MSIPQTIARLESRIGSLERRLENTVRSGPVKEVDPTKQRVRLIVGKAADGTEQLSPWIPYAQQAGALKIHSPPSEGQNMTAFSPGGDLEQAVAMPFTWNDANASPSSSADENVLSFGDVTIKVTGTGVTFSIGGFSVTMSAAGFGASGGSMAHNGKNIGSTHRHMGVRTGGDTSDVPTAGGPTP